jgi:phosphoglycolate phosphatase
MPHLRTDAAACYKPNPIHSSPSPMPFRLALFDFDGTLADSQDWFLGIFDQVADRFGYRLLAPGDRERLRGLDTKAILHDLGVPTWKLPMIAKHVRELATRDIDQIRLFPGATEMLAALKAGGVQAAVVSSNAEGNVRRVLGPAAAHVAHYACGASLFGKASKIRGVLKAMRVEKCDAIFVGDEARDAAAARDVGIDNGLVAWGYADPKFLRSLAPTLFFEHMDEIAPALIG